MSLEEAMDPGFDPPADWTPEAVVGAEMERLKREVGAALAASAIPRRLGPDASPEELAVDKKLSRRIGQSFKTTLQWYRMDLGEWTKAVEWATSDEESRRAGAARDWGAWWRDYSIWVPQRRVQIATWGVKRGERKTANRVVTRLGAELDLVRGAFERTVADGLDPRWMVPEEEQ